MDGVSVGVSKCSGVGNTAWLSALEPRLAAALAVAQVNGGKDAFFFEFSRPAELLRGDERNGSRSPTFHAARAALVVRQPQRKNSRGDETPRE